MKKILLTTLAIGLSLNADYLKYDEFDIKRLGKTFESYVQQTSKKQVHYDNIILSNQQKIEKLSKEVDSLKQQLSDIQIVPKKIKAPQTTNQTNHHKDKRIVKTKKGIIVYSEPFSEDQLYLKKYNYGTILDIESCDQYGWCKLKDKDEYVAQYLLSYNKYNDENE